MKGVNRTYTRIRLYLILVLFIPITALVSAQTKNVPVLENKDTTIAIIMKQEGEIVKLRWAVNDPKTWQHANDSGYILVKYALDTLTSKVDSFVRRIYPWTLSEWKSKCNRNDTTAMMAAQVLYGKSKNAPKGITFDAAIYQENDRTNRHIFALLAADRSFHTAIGLGMGFLDSLKRTNTVVMYEIRVQNPIDSSQYLKAHCASISGGNIARPIPTLTIEPMESKVRVKWFDFTRYYTGFYFEVDDGTTGGFKRISNKPFFPENNKYDMRREYQYDIPITNYHKIKVRMQGYDAFGDLSEYSNVVEGMGVDKTPPQPGTLIELKDLGQGNVKLRWTKSSSSDIKGYMVSRGTSFKGPFKFLTAKLLSPLTTQYIDTTVLVNDKNFYRVMTFDTAGNYVSDIPTYVVIHDHSPPAVPTHFQAKIDSNGIVYFVWDLGPEPDLKGYVISFANNPTDIFQPIQGGFITDTVFQDTIGLHTLTENIYYKLVAFDENRNPSEPTKTLKVKKPDLIPPVTPQFEKYEVLDSAIRFDIIPSSSSDAVSTLVQRKEKGNSTWKNILVLSIDKNVCFDRSVEAQKQYTYRLIAVDDDGLHSKASSELTLKSMPLNRTVQLVPLTGAYNQKEQGIELHLPSINNSDKKSVFLYRSVRNKGLKLYKSFPYLKNTYLDYRINENAQYNYQILVRDQNHHLIAKSVIVTISYTKN